jgi:hypothetical protein
MARFREGDRFGFLQALYAGIFNGAQGTTKIGDSGLVKGEHDLDHYTEVARQRAAANPFA